MPKKKKEYADYKEVAEFRGRMLKESVALGKKRGKINKKYNLQPWLFGRVRLKNLPEIPTPTVYKKMIRSSKLTDREKSRLSDVQFVHDPHMVSGQAVAALDVFGSGKRKIVVPTALKKSMLSKGSQAVIAHEVGHMAKHIPKSRAKLVAAMVTPDKPTWSPTYKREKEAWEVAERAGYEGGDKKRIGLGSYQNARMTETVNTALQGLAVGGVAIGAVVHPVFRNELVDQGKARIHSIKEAASRVKIVAGRAKGNPRAMVAVGAAVAAIGVGGALVRRKVQKGGNANNPSARVKKSWVTRRRKFGSRGSRK